MMKNKPEKNLGNNPRILFYILTNNTNAKLADGVSWCRPNKKNKFFVEYSRRTKHGSASSKIVSRGDIHSFGEDDWTWERESTIEVDQIKKILSDKKFALLNMNHQLKFVSELARFVLKKNIVTDNYYCVPYNELNWNFQKLYNFSQEFKCSIVLAHPITKNRVEQKLKDLQCKYTTSEHKQMKQKLHKIGMKWPGF